MAVDHGPTAPAGPRPFLEFRPLLRALGIASDAKKILLAIVGLLALYTGWFRLDSLFLQNGRHGSISSTPNMDYVWSFDPDVGQLASIRGPLDADTPLVEPFRTIVTPFTVLFRRGVTAYHWSHSALKAFWAAVVWGIFGGAIARIAVVQAAVDRKVGLGSALRFALRHWGSLIGAPLTPMLAVAILAGASALFGLLYRIPAEIGAGIASVLGFVPLLLGLLMALILVGLALGWPLMHVTIAAENEDAPDALSRSYSYVNQRLARYAAHTVAALAIGAVGLMAVIVFARVVLGLADWGVSLGAPSFESLGESARSGRLFWMRLVGLLVLAWAYSYFWSAASIIYLILRRDVDGTDWHDVYLPENAADTFAGEPPAASGEELP
jgi:hypothetical protein